jgi:hypothetical protein
VAADYHLGESLDSPTSVSAYLGKPRRVRMASNSQPAHRVESSQSGKSCRRTTTQIGSDRFLVRVDTLTLCVPLFYNPNDGQQRIAVESWKLLQTEAEIRRLFSGYTRWPAKGWWRDCAHYKEYEDTLIRYEIDGNFDRKMLERIRRWKRVLSRRFRQVEFYFKVAQGVLP